MPSHDKSSKDKNDEPALERTKAIMTAMLHMPPKPHSEMKLGKGKPKPDKAARPKSSP